MRKPRPLAPPNLQALIEAHGGYEAITPQGWAVWDVELSKYRRLIREGWAWEGMGR